jgi:hypothetical protein
MQVSPEEPQESGSAKEVAGRFVLLREWLAVISRALDKIFHKLPAWALSHKHLRNFRRSFPACLGHPFLADFARNGDFELQL